MSRDNANKFTLKACQNERLLLKIALNWVNNMPRIKWR
jgi:hypothetical protein